MRKRLPKILVTGGAGFIGSACVRLLLKRDCPRQGYQVTPSPIGWAGVPPPAARGLSLKNKVIIIDKLTYAGDLARLKEVEGRYEFYKADICDKAKIESVFKKEKPEIIVHFAAETHVDRSIRDARVFITTNIIGTQVLLDLSRKYRIKRFIHISTDEVYGDIEKGKFKEDSPLKPNSPYAASKAAADLLIRSYIRTYGFPAIIIRPCNNYGPWQYPEKLIPVIISKALRGQKVPVYARGLNVREWLYVLDCAEAIMLILRKGKIGEIYNLGSSDERTNIDTAKAILGILGKPHSLIDFVADRPGHDFRYSLNSSKIRKLGWRPKTGFSFGITQTINWYKNNLFWLRAKTSNR